MRRSGLSAPQQAFALHARFQDAKCVLKAGRLLWTGVLEPTPLSRTYLVEISYRPGGVPHVRVLETLAKREGMALPHVYADGTLCLHEPGEWTDRMYIVDTTVPWTAEWLANYEIWLATDEWYGGGVWPPRQRDAGDSVLDAEAKQAPQQAA